MKINAKEIFNIYEKRKPMGKLFDSLDFIGIGNPAEDEETSKILGERWWIYRSKKIPTIYIGLWDIGNGWAASEFFISLDGYGHLISEIEAEYSRLTKKAEREKMRKRRSQAS